MTVNGVPNQFSNLGVQHKSNVWLLGVTDLPNCRPASILVSVFCMPSSFAGQAPTTEEPGLESLVGMDPIHPTLAAAASLTCCLVSYSRDLILASGLTPMQMSLLSGDARVCEGTMVTNSSSPKNSICRAECLTHAVQEELVRLFCLTKLATSSGVKSRSASVK